MAKTIGIDLGTTNSCMAVLEGGEPTVVRIINEPTAAALAYGLEKEEEQTVLVFDLGGGTFDVSVLELAEGFFQVKSTAGDNHLGGDNFDKAVVDWMVGEFKKQQGIDLSQDKMALQRLYEAAEKAKIELSSTMTTQINLPFITATQEGPKHLDLQLTRAKLEEITADLLARTVGPTKQALEDAGLTPDKIDHVVLVGGMTRMPAVEDEVKRMIQDAESHADEAHRLREAADTKNMAETLAYQTERSLKEHRDKLDESEAATIEGRIMELRQALQGDDLTDIRAKSEALQE